MKRKKFKPIDIATKALDVIIKCDQLKYVRMMDRYVDLAVVQILKKKTAKKYEYATKLEAAAHCKVFNLIKERELKKMEAEIFGRVD